ncbi:MAG: type I DNA topoisomerase [Flavobacteriales bacterium]
MPKNLVIVESPAKAKTIQGYLGKDFQVESSFGHVSDLVKKGMGIDIENNFKPLYEVSSDKKEIVKKLKKLAEKAETIWLASDEDREGEAIAWHLKNELKLPDEKIKRIVFHEITKNAILRAVENPRSIDYNLVNAQQARRVLDRLVGFELSPVLWRKVKGGLSAGRVQSVSVRLIVEREKEIRAFVPDESYRVTAEFKTVEGKIFKAELRNRFKTKQETLDYLEKTIGADFVITDLVKKPAKKSPAAPFTTSTLQQEASRKMGYSVSMTMQLAQRLYESGHITYMRTDSVNLSSDAKKAIEAEIKDTFGTPYFKGRNYSTKTKGAQEAHEAIRPTDMSRQIAGGDERQKKLYNLIWKRTVASQMADAKLERTTVSIDSSKTSHLFVAKGEIITFDGFLKLYLESTDDEKEEENELLPKMNKGEAVQHNQITAQQRFSKPPARYTEASLVKKLEELGIGRPSTYAPTISTIQRREYVEKSQLEGIEREYDYIILKVDKIKASKRKERTGADRNKLIPTEIGIIVNDFLVEHFENILDYSFTAQVEEEFDTIASGKEGWTEMIGDFYGDFHHKIEDVKENADRATGERLLGKHPDTGKNVYVKIGRFGPMVQIGEADDKEKPLFSSLRKDMVLSEVQLNEVLDLFKLPLNLGKYEGKDVEVNEGRFGPYVKYNGKFISLGKGTNPLEVDYDEAVKIIIAKQKADAPIAEYEGKPVQKGTGRFGPFIKWDNMFINVNKKYDFDNLSQKDVETLIEDKKRKEIEKFIHHWKEEGISVQKARWGRFNIVQGKTKIELPKDFDVQSLTLEKTRKIIAEQAPKKKKNIKKKTTNKKR